MSSQTPQTPLWRIPSYSITEVTLKRGHYDTWRCPSIPWDMVHWCQTRTTRDRTEEKPFSLVTSQCSLSRSETTKAEPPPPWPPHEWSTLMKNPVLFLEGHKFLMNKRWERDGEHGGYFYCVHKRECQCKASAQGVVGEGKIKISYDCHSTRSCDKTVSRAGSQRIKKDWKSWAGNQGFKCECLNVHMSHMSHMSHLSDFGI